MYADNNSLLTCFIGRFRHDLKLNCGLRVAEGPNIETKNEICDGFVAVMDIAPTFYEVAHTTSSEKFEDHDLFPLKGNSYNVGLTKAMLPSLQESAGAQNVLLVPQTTIGEDFSFYAQKIPGLFFGLGGMSKGKDPKAAGPHHTPEFIIDDTAFKLGVITFCNMVFDYAELNKK